MHSTQAPFLSNVFNMHTAYLDFVSAVYFLLYLRVRHYSLLRCCMLCAVCLYRVISTPCKYIVLLLDTLLCVSIELLACTVHYFYLLCCYQSICSSLILLACTTQSRL